jgi:hypothetical protein
MGLLRPRLQTGSTPFAKWYFINHRKSQGKPRSNAGEEDPISYWEGVEKLYCIESRRETSRLIFATEAPVFYFSIPYCAS